MSLSGSKYETPTKPLTPKLGVTRKKRQEDIRGLGVGQTRLRIAQRVSELQSECQRHTVIANIDSMNNTDVVVLLIALWLASLDTALRDTSEGG